MDAADHELGERGYALLPSTNPLFLHTPWKVRGNHDVFTSWSRVYLEGRKLADGRLVVRAWKVAANIPARTQLLPGPFSTAYVTPEEKPTPLPPSCWPPSPCWDATPTAPSSAGNWGWSGPSCSASTPSSPSASRRRWTSTSPTPLAEPASSR